MTFDELKEHVIALSDYCSETSCGACEFGGLSGECELFTEEVYMWRRIAERAEWRQEHAGEH